MTVTVTTKLFVLFSRAPFFAAQGSAEAGFERCHEAIVADGSADDFTLPQRRIIFIPTVLIEKIREIVDPRMQRSGRGKPVIHTPQVGANA